MSRITTVVIVVVLALVMVTVIEIQKNALQKALEKGCTHCCDCYIGPMVKNFPK